LKGEVKSSIDQMPLTKLDICLNGPLDMIVTFMGLGNCLIKIFSQDIPMGITILLPKFILSFLTT